MKAIAYSTPGDFSVLSLVERVTPEPGPGEVRVRVVVSGVNPTDAKSRASVGRELADAEVIPNQDGAGTVDAVGLGVEGLAVGHRVWISLAAHQRAGGTAAGYCVVPADRAVPLAGDASFALGASLGVPAMTAHRALTVHEFGPACLSPGALDGRIVLVQGGAGAVGHAAIQLSTWAGATVIATVSSDEKEALARAAGAHHVLRYPDAALSDRIRQIAPDGVDQILEVAIAQNPALDVEVVAHHGSTAMTPTTAAHDAVEAGATGKVLIRVDGSRA